MAIHTLDQIAIPKTNWQARQQQRRRQYSLKHAGGFGDTEPLPVSAPTQYIAEGSGDGGGGGGAGESASFFSKWGVPIGAGLGGTLVGMAIAKALASR